MWMVRYRCIKMLQGVHHLRKPIALGNTPYVNATADGEHTNAGETLRVRENDKMRKQSVE